MGAADDWFKASDEMPPYDERVLVDLGGRLEVMRLFDCGNFQGWLSDWDRSPMLTADSVQFWARLRPPDEWDGA